MKIQNYTLGEVNGIKVKTDFKSFEEEHYWLFKTHYYLQIIYDDKYKKTKKWNSKEAIKLKSIINIMRLRELGMGEYLEKDNISPKFRKSYGKEKVIELGRDLKRLMKIIRFVGNEGKK